MFSINATATFALNHRKKYLLAKDLLAQQPGHQTPALGKLFRVLDPTSAGAEKVTLVLKEWQCGQCLT